MQKQMHLFKKKKSDYGGVLLKTRTGRSSPRPLAIKNTMHLVMRSSKAKDDWSFKHPQNEKEIRRIIHKFA